VNLEDIPSCHFETDRARERYERLRELYLHGSVEPADPDAEHFWRRGLAGLFDSGPLQDYWVEVHEAKIHGWGHVNPREAALREAMRLLLMPEHLANHSPRRITERRIAL
jgi:hypothetical protein